MLNFYVFFHERGTSALGKIDKGYKRFFLLFTKFKNLPVSQEVHKFK